RLAEGKLIEAATVHGRASEGVLCSPAELGLGKSHEGLLECPPELAPGTALSDFIPARDVLIEIDNKSLTHRPDLWGHYGFAREFSSIFGRPLRELVVEDLSAFAGLPAYPIEVESAEDCPAYSATEIEVAGNRASSLVVQRRLLALGLRPISALVDVTNYVQYELGQPSHAFDARHVQRIRVGRSGKERKYATLDGATYDLQPADLLIYNGDEPVALAGIMGGKESQVTAETRKILLECANFKGSRVRMTSVRLGLRTDASLRFEKKLPPYFVKQGVGRILRVLRDSGLEPKAVSRFSVVGDLRGQERRITVPAGYLTRRSGTEISNERATQILSSIGFRCEAEGDGSLAVGIPPFRSEHDMSILEDVSEEVMRLYGYDQITPQIPVTAIKSAPIHVPTRTQHRARRILAQGHRFLEIQTYGWFADEWLEVLGYTPGSTLNLRNALGSNRGRMRDTLVPNLLAAVNLNRKVRERFRIFELGRIFRVGPDGKKLEGNELAGVSVDQTGRTSPEQHVREIRGAIDDLAATNGLQALQYAPVEPSHMPWIAPGRALSISLGGEVIGHVGLLPDSLKPHAIDAGNAVWFALDADRLAGEIYPAMAYQAPPVFPGSWQDFTIVWPTAEGYAGLAATLDRFSHRCLDRWTLIDYYKPKASETGNYSFRFLLRLPDRTLSSEEIQDFRDAMLAFIQREGLKLV
ncbi:MAG TPA: phenylalanine--tRNA ligase subunit beta, partial [Candidatus Nanopelagicales bacterium]|nr:phenylalanine--tRNA ligase subunit beta [Candidatus Nanopelagicales bacterium]